MYLNFIQFSTRRFIRTFVCVKFFIHRIYLDIHLCNFLYKCFRSFVCVKIFTNVTLCSRSEFGQMPCAQSSWCWENLSGSSTGDRRVSIVEDGLVTALPSCLLHVRRHCATVGQAAVGHCPWFRNLEITDLKNTYIMVSNIKDLTFAPAASILSTHSSKVSIIAEQLVNNPVVMILSERLSSWKWW